MVRREKTQFSRKYDLNIFYLACIDQSEKDRWLSKLDNSNWLLHVKEALTTACIVAQTIDCEGRMKISISID
jgi:hypothetical protein